MSYLETRLKEIKVRCNKSTKEPWDHTHIFDREEVISSSNVQLGVWTGSECNGRFIAHARTDVPMLLEIVETLRVKIKACQSTLGHSCFQHHLNTIDRIAEKYK